MFHIVSFVSLPDSRSNKYVYTYISTSTSRSNINMCMYIIYVCVYILDSWDLDDIRYIVIQDIPDWYHTAGTSCNNLKSSLWLSLELPPWLLRSIVQDEPSRVAPGGASHTNGFNTGYGDQKFQVTPIFSGEQIWETRVSTLSFWGVPVDVPMLSNGVPLLIGDHQ